MTFFFYLKMFFVCLAGVTQFEDVFDGTNTFKCICKRVCSPLLLKIKVYKVVK